MQTMSNFPTNKMLPNCGEGGDGGKWTSGMISRKLMVAIFETPSITMTPYMTARKLGLLSSSGNNTKPWVIGSLIGGIAVVFAIFCVLVWYICYVTRRQMRRSVRLSSVQSTYTQFSYSQIVQGTNNFDENRVIGQGGFGKVYLGTLEDGTSVAIKKGSGLHHQGVKEFRAEIELLLKLRHYHLISLLGYCDENSEMILVYEYMDNGTLRQHLHNGIHDPPEQPLAWTQRLKIARDAAIGLHYLHTGSQRPIIHRDVKSSNILLNRNLVTKVSDFGLSKELPPMDNTELSAVKGSFGYMDPEYQQLQRFTDKSDVYSFGVVLFELISSRPALDPTLPEEQLALASWALHCYKNNILDQLIDPRLQEEILPQCLDIYVGTAVRCVAAKGKDRPSMGDVLVCLQRALDLQENRNVFLEMPPDGSDGSVGGGMPYDQDENQAYRLVEDVWNGLPLYPP